jgi:hypothetical protein
VVGDSGVLLSIALPGTAEQVIHAVRNLGLEGVIAKRTTSRYAAGARSDAWGKLKLDRQQEFVIGGYRPGPHGVDALLVGYYAGGALRSRGRSERDSHGTSGARCSTSWRPFTRSGALSATCRPANPHGGVV